MSHVGLLASEIQNDESLICSYLLKKHLSMLICHAQLKNVDVFRCFCSPKIGNYTKKQKFAPAKIRRISYKKNFDKFTRNRDWKSKNWGLLHLEIGDGNPKIGKIPLKTEIDLPIHFRIVLSLKAILFLKLSFKERLNTAIYNKFGILIIGLLYHIAEACRGV